MHRLCSLFAVVLTLTLFVGCAANVEDSPSFEPNWVHAMKHQIKESVPMDQAWQDAFWIVDQMFGTPDDPKIPPFLAEDDRLSTLLSMDSLQMASGPADQVGRGLFRKHCVVCHGVTGNGRGPTAALQNPYPRDYRMGIFKFKSTALGGKPTKEDLAKLIKGGINGTAMVRIPELSDADVAALTDYVIYLSWRGELERVVIDEAIFEGILEDSRIIDTRIGQKLVSDSAYRQQIERLADGDPDELSNSQLKQVEALESWQYAEQFAGEIAESWLDAADEVIPAGTPPAEIPIAENHADVQRLGQGAQSELFLASVKRGGEVFRGPFASCSKCHGEQGLGNGQTTDYDAWTKDWTIRAGLNPQARDSLIPLLARGAMEPRHASPRNLTSGIFRGGASSADLYRRITQGIDGSPMPSATFVPGEFEESDVWHLINFIRSLEQPAS